MMTGRLALVIALAGCGRLGFADVAGHTEDGGNGGDGAVGEVVTLVVTSDEYASEPAGKPIAGATVLVDRGAGGERLVTDAAGRAQFAAAGALACHVVFKSELGWRGYTVALPLAAMAGATIELGGRPASNPTHNITLALPSNATADSYTARLPEHCAFPPMSGSPSVSTSFDAACEGASVHAIGFAFPLVGSGSPDLYLDAGMVTLSNGATRTVTGSYQQLPVRTLQLTNLPVAATSATARIVSRAGIDVTSLTPTPDSATPSGGAASLQMGVAPGGNGIEVTVFGGLPVQYQTSSVRISPLPAAPGVLDAGAMLPLFDSMVLTDPTRVAWTGAAGGTIAIVERNANGVQWDWYLPPSATAATLPRIPDDLGVPAPKVPDYAQAVKLDVPGTTAADLVLTIDRRWPGWPHDAMLFPPAGSAQSQIFYTAALGPPSPPRQPPRPSETRKLGASDPEARGSGAAQRGLGGIR